MPKCLALAAYIGGCWRISAALGWLGGGSSL